MPEGASWMIFGVDIFNADRVFSEGIIQHHYFISFSFSSFCEDFIAVGIDMVDGVPGGCLVCYCVA